MTPGIIRALLLMAVLVAMSVGGIAGVRLGEAVSAPEQRHVVLEALDAMVVAPVTAARSAGGFTGFDGAGGLHGEVMRSGAVESSGGNTAVITTSESRVSIHFTRADRFFAIARATAPLRAGDLVQIRARDGTATAILRVPAGIEQGGNR